MEPLARNLRVISGSDRALADALGQRVTDSCVQVAQAATGAPSFAVDGRLETSAHDPEADGRACVRRLLERAERDGTRRLVVFGLPIYGFPDLAGFAGEVAVVEPNVALVRAVLERFDLAGPLAHVALLVPGSSSSGRDRRTGPWPEVTSHPAFSGDGRGLLLALPAAERRAPALLAELRGCFVPGGPSESLDVAVIPPLHGGSLPVAEAAARALRSLGHRVRPLDLEAFLPAYRAVDGLLPDLRLDDARGAVRAGLTRLIGQALLAGYRLDPPDLVFAMAQAPLDGDTLRDIRKLGVPVAYWFCEDFHVMPYWRALAPSCDVFFHLQPDAFSEPLAAAGGHGFPLPMAFDPVVQRPLEGLEDDREMRFDLSFVGAAYHNRLRFLPGLFDLGLRVFGVGWPDRKPWTDQLEQPGERQSSEASNRIFNASRINLNLHSSPWTDGVNPAGDYLNPRTFELAGARAFQLVDERSDLAAAFEPGVEIVTFRDLADCRTRIEHFRNADDERREIATRAHARALREHTYRQRMELALEVLAAGEAAPRARSRASGAVARALSEAAAEPGLRAVLGRLDPDSELDADALTTAVARGRGALTEDEKLLLFMREAATEVEFTTMELQS